MRKSGLTGDEAYALSKRRGTSGDLDPLKKELGQLKEDLDDKFVVGKNLIDVNKIQNGKNISSDGRIVDDSNFEITNKIRLLNGETLRVSNNGTSISVLFAIYRNDGTFVERKNLEYFTATFDCYVILRFNNNYIETRKYIQAEINDVVTYYETYYEGIKRYEDKLFITPEDFGAVGDGVIDDTIAIKNAIKAQQYTKKEIRFSKTYIVTSPLNFESVMYLNIEPNSVIKANPSSQIDYLINFNTTQHDEWTRGLSQGSYIIGGGTIDCNGKVKDAIRLSYYYGLRIHDIFVKNFTSRGIITGMYGNIGGHLDMNNVEFDNTNTLLYGTIGIYNNRTDNTFYNIRCRDVQTGIYTNNDGNFNEVHCWIIRSALWKNSKFCVLENARDVFFVKPYCDTMQYGFYDGGRKEKPSLVNITDLHYLTASFMIENDTYKENQPIVFYGTERTEFRVFGGVMELLDGNYFSNLLFNRPVFMDIRYSEISGTIHNLQTFNTINEINSIKERILALENTITN